MSAAIFCHEIGHHAIGFTRYKPRCLEEYHAWAWSFAEMERRGFTRTTLYVEGDNTAAIRTYERSGYSRTALDVQYAP